MNARDFDILSIQIASKELTNVQKRLGRTALPLTENQEAAVMVSMTRISRLSMETVAQLSKEGFDISDAATKGNLK